ncbi:MAG: DUF255 domain-containing protein [Oligoflexia bacterium]|nr:DUF255 domain-containing protein [Oligoflexia bacterium]
MTFSSSVRLAFMFSVALLCRANCWAIPTNAINWRQWSEQVFTEAARDKKLILLDLEAIWCHWCHVMEEQTYSDPEVISIINKSFIALRVDQDARPDLAARYRDYGWPATIVLSAKGEDLWKGSGFIEADELGTTLKKLVLHPVPQSNVSLSGAEAVSGVLEESVRVELARRHSDFLDRQVGGLKSVHKFLNPHEVEFALARAASGDEPSRLWVALTLESNLKLIDPIWGGAYQYSTRGGWDYPHFEKIMYTQANAMTLYALGAELSADVRFLNAAQAVRRFIGSFLTAPHGGFYTSMDADLKKGEHSANYFPLDDAGRRALGVPAVDKNLYARENGQMIRALAVLAGASGDAAALAEAVRAANWTQKNRSIEGGGFSHGENATAGLYFSDNLEMLRAFIALYMCSADRSWLAAAQRVAEFALAHFVEGELDAGVGGFFTAQPETQSVLKPVKVTDENIDAARAFNLLYHYTGDDGLRRAARHAMRYLAQRAVALEYSVESGILLADAELGRDPLHITIVGHKDDQNARALFAAGLRYFSLYKRIEWWDKREGNLPRNDVQYPELERAAAFICTNKRCSLPLFSPEKLTQTITGFAAK